MREAVREAEAALDVDLDLVDAVEAVLDRILDRHHDAVTAIQVVDRAVQHGRLARAGRPADDHGAVWLLDRRDERRLGVRLHLERRDGRMLVAAAAEDPQHDLLAVRRRHDRDSHVDEAGVEERGDATFLRSAAVGDVEPAHHLQPARDRLLHVARHGRELAHDAVDANPDEHVLASWLEVEVGCALLERSREQRVDEGDRRHARGEVADVGDALLLGRFVALLDDQLQRAAIRPRDRVVDLRALGDGDPEARSKCEAEVVGGRDVRRVGDGEERRAVLEDAKGQRLVSPRQFLRQQGDRLLVELGRRRGRRTRARTARPARPRSPARS